MPSSGLQSIWIRLPSTDVLGFTHIVPQGGTAGFCDTLWNPGARYQEDMVGGGSAVTTAKNHRQGCLCHPSQATLFLKATLELPLLCHTEPGPFRARGLRSSELGNRLCVSGM